MSSLKKKTVHGFKWNAIEQIAVKGGRFVIGVILARLLMPSAYGITGLIAVFMAISQVFITSGFGVALIQKKDRTDVDYATVFYFNLVVSIICWVGLFFSRNFFAEFFNEPLLVQITPVIGLNLIFNAFALVQITKLTAELNFKRQAKISVVSTLIAGCVGIYFAYNGFGVWALVYQSISRTFITAIMLWIWDKWLPPLVFSLESFKHLFSFGSKMMLSGLISTTYQNIYTLIIGKFFSTSELGFFNRAKQFRDLPSQNFTMILKRVSFPVLSKIQDDDEKLTRSFRKFITMSNFVIMPLMLSLMVLARPIVILSLTDKWEPTVILLQLLCLGGIMYPIHALNLAILQVKGRSDLFLKLEIIKKVLTTIIILITFTISVKALIIGSLIGSVIALFINTHYTKKILEYGIITQVKDFIPTIILSSVMVSSMIITTYFIESNLLKLIVGTLVAISSYTGLAYMLKLESFHDVKDIIKNLK